MIRSVWAGFSMALHFRAVFVLLHSWHSLPSYPGQKNPLTETEAKLSARHLCLSILANVVSHRPFEKQGLRNLPHALIGVGCTAGDHAGQLWELPCSSWQSWSTWLLCGCDRRKVLSFDMRKALSLWEVACLSPCLLCLCVWFTTVSPFGFDFVNCGNTSA